MSAQSRVRPLLVSLLGIAPLLMASAVAAPFEPAQAPPVLPVVPSVIECSKMTAQDVSKEASASTVVDAAEVVDSGKTAAFCKLQVTVDDYAKFELHMPVALWEQRLLFGGGPGAQVAEGAMGTDRFASVSWQDLGRRNHEDVFADNYQYRINAGYRGMHLQVLAAKALIARFYGQAPRYAYFNACSEPGREGMMEVQRFPEDFDGVGAGCPPINFPVNQGIFEGWNVLTNRAADGKPILTADKLPILHNAVLAQCDAADGAKDGIVSDPLSCHPNVKAVACKAGQEASTCLTPAQVHVAEELYRGAHDGQGTKLVPIGVLPGSELAWVATIVPMWNPTEPFEQTTTAIRSQFHAPALPMTWQLSELKFDRASFDAITQMHYLFDATDPDLSGFAQRGHKLILWQGMGDTNVLPAHAVLYYAALQKQMGDQAVDGFVRFYTLPGVYHCGSGDGPIVRDFLLPLMQWVERGIAPDALPGVHIPRPERKMPGGPSAPGMARPGAGPGDMPQGEPDLTRPIYPYPYTAKYVGTGSVRDAANFVKGPAPKPPAALFDWRGAKFYAPHNAKWCTAQGTAIDCKDSRP